MKFQNVQSFLHNLKSGSHPKVILIITADPYERKTLIDQIFPEKNSLSFARFNASNHTTGKVIEALDSPFLIGGEPQIVFEEIELLKKNDLDKLIPFLSQRYAGTLLLASANKKNLISLSKEVDNRGVILDLSTEKIWEREKRFSEFVKAKCFQSQKKIEEKAVSLLIERAQRDLAYLSNELEKLITYVGSQTLITEEDVRGIGTALHQETVWKIAEKMVWEKRSLFTLSEQIPIDSTFFHTLIVALRYQYQLGYKLVSLKNAKPGSYSQHFAKQPPWLLEKRKPVAMKLGENYFQKALQELFSIDLLSKNQVQDFSSLLTLFETKMQTVNLS